MQSHRHTEPPRLLSSLNQPDPNLNLDFDFLTSWLVHAEGVPWTVSFPIPYRFGADSSSIFLLEHGQTDRSTDKITDAAEKPYPRRRLHSRRGY